MSTVRPHQRESAVDREIDNFVSQLIEMDLIDSEEDADLSEFAKNAVSATYGKDKRYGQEEHSLPGTSKELKAVGVAAVYFIIKNSDQPNEMTLFYTSNIAGLPMYCIEQHYDKILSKYNDLAKKK